MKIILTKVFAVLSLSFCSIAAIAAEDKETQGGEEVDGKHTVGVFLGATYENDEYLETIGIEYSYRFTKLWSAGVEIERANREKDSTLVAGFVHLWPWKDLFVGGGIGMKDPAGDWEGVLRATIGYEIEIYKGWSIAPQVNWDFIANEENEEVYGITAGKRF